jgi:hypothetical protein
MRFGCLSVLLLIGACNAPPQGIGLLLGPESPTTRDELALTIEGGDDPDGDPVSTTVTWFRDGVAQNDHADALAVPASTTAKHQTWKAYVVPSDGTLEGPASSVEVTILNTPPVVDDVLLDPVAPLTEEDVTVSATTSDADGDEVALHYAWLRNGELTSYSAATLPRDATLRGERWTVEVTPVEAQGDEAEGEVVSATVDIENSAPDIDSVVLSFDDPIHKDGPYETSTFSVEVEASDDDGDPITLSYAWYVDGELVLEGAEPTLTGEHFDKHQEVLVEVWGHDGFIDGDASESDTLTVLDSPPIIADVALDPSEIREATVVACSPLGETDADGDDVSYTYRWYVDGRLATVTTQTIDGGSFDKGHTLFCRATPNDGEIDGEAVESAAVTVLNTAPVIDGAALSKLDPAEGESLSVELSGARDDDGDGITYAYAWYVDSALVSSATSIDSTQFDKGDAIYVEVTPNDGTEDGDTVQSDVATAVNSAPCIDGLSFASSNLYTNDVASLQVATTDLDGDEVSLTYAWQVDGSSAGVTSETLDGASWFDKGQDVGVWVTPNDGEVDGGPVYSSIEVANSAPGAPTVYITPTVPDGYEDELVCNIATEAVDADDDPLTYTALWSVDGSRYLGTRSTTVASGDTIPAGESVGGEVWGCQLWANDGTDDGELGEDEVTVGGAYLRDDFTVDYGWQYGSSTGFAIAAGQLEWEVEWNDPASGEVIWFEIEPLAGSFVLEFDIRVDSMEENSMGGGYGLYLGVRESMSSSEGVYLMASDRFVDSASYDWRFTGMCCGLNCGYGLSGFHGMYGDHYHVYLRFEASYFSSGSALETFEVYDSFGALVFEDSVATGGAVESVLVFNYVSLSVGGTSGTSSICCDGSGIIDNLELRAWEE